MDLIKKALQIPQGRNSFLITILGILLAIPAVKFFGDSKFILFFVLIISVVTGESARAFGLILVQIRDSEKK